MDNAQSPELRTYLAGQIARACAVFCVDEVVIFDEQGDSTRWGTHFIDNGGVLGGQELNLKLKQDDCFQHCFYISLIYKADSRVLYDSVSFSRLQRDILIMVMLSVILILQ